MSEDHYFHLPPLQVSPSPTSSSTREEVLCSRAEAIQQQWGDITHVPSIAKLTLAASLAKQGNLKCPKPGLHGINCYSGLPELCGPPEPDQCGHLLRARQRPGGPGQHHRGLRHPVQSEGRGGGSAGQHRVPRPTY